MSLLPSTTQLYVYWFTYEVSLEKFYLRCALTCHWCVRVKCSGASDAVAHDYKKGLETPLKGLYVCLKNELLNEEQLNV